MRVAEMREKLNEIKFQAWNSSIGNGPLMSFVTIVIYNSNI
jgi:hypothetical protein